MQLENKVVITTSIVVDFTDEEEGNSTRLEQIVDAMRHAILDQFSSDITVQPIGCIVYDWLNDARSNFGRCKDCERLVSNCEKPGQIRGLIDARIVDGTLLCDECAYFRREPKSDSFRDG